MRHGLDIIYSLPVHSHFVQREKSAWNIGTLLQYIITELSISDY